MTIQDLLDAGTFHTIHKGENTDREIRDVFCCDLLSVVLGKGKEDAAWVTVMGNVNALAVLSLTDMACLVLAEGAVMDENGLARAREEGITILGTEEPIFTAACRIHEALLS